MPVDQCNTSGENGKQVGRSEMAFPLNSLSATQGGYEADICGQWTLDPGSNGNLY